MNRLGVMVDVSHISDDAFWQALEVSERPLLASHSSARAIETVRVTSPSGGGYGNPLDRDPQRVWQDLQDGFVTAAQARDQYGVVVNGNGVDVNETKQVRNAMRAKQGDIAAFNYGKERKDYEVSLPETVQDLVFDLLARFPAATRQQLRNIAYDFVLSNGVAEATEQELAALIHQSIDQARKPVLHRTARASRHLDAANASYVSIITGCQ